MNRREFIKASSTAAAVARVNLPLSVRAAQPQSSIPSLSRLASLPMRHGFMELFNLPIAMNDWGYAQTVKSVSGLMAICFPPYACCGIPDVPWSPGYLRTCEIFIDGKFAALSDVPEEAVTYQWFPQKVVRQQHTGGLEIRTTTFMPQKTRAVVQKIELRNLDASARELTIDFEMRGAAIRKENGWFNEVPGEGDNALSWNSAAGRLTFAAQHSSAACAQGIHPPAQEAIAGNMLRYHISFGAHEQKELHYVAALDANAAEAESLHDRLQSGFAGLETENEEAFTHLVRSAFTPSNSAFSGHLPQLSTSSEALWELYFNGVKNLLSARRHSPDSKYGPTWLTLSGHVLPTLSFPWDTALSSLALALLDPQPLRQLIEVWFTQNMHEHLATDYITGEAVGPWYGVNDMAIVRCARNYLRVTGDFEWLDKRIGDQTVLDHLISHATWWKKLVKGNSGLADYGKISNLLEVVSTYLHEVAGMNAGNVSSMRFVAEILERRNRAQEAAQLRSEAANLAKRINDLLYVSGKGWWRCGQPDGSFNEVRHCYDFLSVLDNMSDDLAAGQKREMAQFFWQQLASRKWMRALATGDADATWNVRPDHSCLGAYAAWPAMCAKGLYRIGDTATTAAWLSQVAMAGNQGPIGQAHFTEDVVPPFHGGAFKASEDAPYIEDWCCIAGGAFTDLVIDSIFGVEYQLFDGLKAAPRVNEFDVSARLDQLHYQGAEYSVSAGAVKRMA